MHFSDEVMVEWLKVTDKWSEVTGK